MVNVLGTQCVLDAIARAGSVSHLGYISSRSAVGETSSAEEAIASDQPIQKYGSGEANRDWLWFGDAVAGILAAMWNPSGFSVFNFGTGVSTTLNQLISVAEEVVGRKAKIIEADVPAGDAIVAGVCDYARAKNLLGWNPKIDLRTGVAMTYQYMLTNVRRGAVGSIT